MEPLTPNLLEPSTSSLLSSAPPAPPSPPPVSQLESDYREFGDTSKTRDQIYADVLAATQAIEPVSNERHTLRLTGVDYQDPDRVSKKDQKAAILGGLSRGRRMRGTWELSDNATGQLLDKKKSVLMTVPHMTERGTFINKGSEYTLKNQQRLLPGVYTRVRDNGEVESHANIMPGKGVSHRYFLDPEKGVFKIRIGQGTVGLMPLLKAMGANQEDLKDAWGNNLFAANYNEDDAAEYSKLKQKFLSKKELEGDDKEQREALVDKFANMEMDPYVTNRTLGSPHKGLTLDAVMDITKKLVAVSKNEAEPDDRDALPYQRFVGPEDLFSERIARDKGGQRRNLLWKMSGKGNLKGMPSSALNKQLMATLMTSGLGQAIEEINPAELYDKSTAVSRLGEGGIPSMDAIPMESRSVQPSMLGYIDPVRTPESGKVGVDTYLARGARKGKDGKLYSRFRDVRTGELTYKSPQDMADVTIAFPDSMDQPGKRVAAMRNGKMTYVPKTEVDFVLPAMEEAFNPLSNIIPMKSQVKGQRLVMASRMTTQALPIVDAESPLVQSAVPGTEGGKSYEELYSKTMGAVRSPQGGVVKSVDDDGITMRYDDGTEETHEMYDNFPFNRKTFIHQTPTVQPGDRVEPDQLLAHSNFTDKGGSTALGTNARTAYVSWQGKNFEDANIISESYAKRMSSEHMYQHDMEIDDRTKVGKKSFIQLFPGKFDKATLSSLDDNGIIKPGTTVHYGDPLILGATQKDAAYNKVHKKGQAGFNDSTVLWEHHDAGTVTDVAMGKKGPTVVVKAIAPMQVGDKLCFDPDTSLLTRNGWKPVTDIQKSDELATLNPSTDCLEWHCPELLHSYEHQGEMYQLQTKHIDMLVTLNHDLWVCRPGEAYAKVTAAEFYASKGEWQFKKDCSWNGVEQSTFKPPDIPIWNSNDNTLPEVPMDLWLKFLGYYIAEGRRTRTTSGGYQVQVSQFTTSDSWQAIADCLDQLEVRWSYRENENRFEINSKSFYASLDDCGDDAYTKRVPDYAKELSSRQIRIFFEAYMDGDGHRGACWEYGTSSSQLSFDLEVLLLKLGWCGSPREVDRNDNFQKNPHWRTRVNRYHLRPWWKKRRAKQYKSVTEGVVNYSGQVYCVTVSNHLVYAKRGGKSYWSGNSGRYG